MVSRRLGDRRTGHELTELQRFEYHRGQAGTPAAHDNPGCRVSRPRQRRGLGTPTYELKTQYGDSLNVKDDHPPFQRIEFMENDVFRVSGESRFELGFVGEIFYDVIF
jgi:hypothetical protein